MNENKSSFMPPINKQNKVHELCTGEKVMGVIMTFYSTVLAVATTL